MLTSPIEANETELPVNSTEGFSVGDTIVIEGGGNSESAVIASLGSIVLSSGTTNSYPANTTVTLYVTTTATSTSQTATSISTITSASGSSTTTATSVTATTVTATTASTTTASSSLSSSTSTSATASGTTASSTATTTTPTTTTATPCGDFIPEGEDKWYDPLGDAYDCGWYATNSDLYCGTFAEDTPHFGVTANEACCACGGGVSHPTTVTNTSTTPCTDWQPAPGDGWLDQENNTCEFYALELESERGCNGSENFNRTAAEACCVCGGGVGGVTTTGSSTATSATSSTSASSTSRTSTTTHADFAPLTSDQDGKLASIGLGGLESWLEDLPTAALVGLAAGAAVVLCGAALATARACCRRGAGAGPSLLDPKTGTEIVWDDDSFFVA